MNKELTLSNKLLYFILLIVLFVSSSNFLFAQTKGRIVGRVTDTGSGDFLPGANVMIKGTTFGAASDREGRYRIDNVPPGTFTLAVSYIGYDEYSAEVSVTAGSTVKQDIALKQTYVEMKEVTVLGLREGQMKALSQQKTAVNIKNVVDAEQIQRFPDVNSAEVLQRVSGVSVTRDGGEGRFVLIRGMAAQLSNTTINGEKIPSPQGDVRYVALDGIAADQLAGIEVTKAITPDMDGNAIGGSVNLRTKSALDYPNRVLNVTLGSGYNDLLSKGIYQGGFTYGNRFGSNQNIGLMFSGSYQQSNRGSDNNEMEWGSEDDVNDVEILWALRNMEMRDYEFQRNRMTFSGTMDYLLSENNRLYLDGIFSRYEDSENRRRLRIRPEKGDYNSATDISEAAIDAQLRNRDQNQTMYNIAAGGEHQLDKLKLDYRLSYSYAEEEEGHHMEANFELDEDADLMLNLSNTDTPKWTTNLGQGYEYDPAHYVLDALEIHDNLTYDRDITGSFNLELPYLLGGNQASFKLGGKAIFKEKDRDENISEYGWGGDDDVLMSQFPGSYKDANFLNSSYPLPPYPDTDKIWSFYNTNKGGLLEGEVLYEDTDGGTYNASEDVFAYYGMTTVHFGDMMLLGGFRHEITKIDYTGHEVVFNEDGDYEGTTTLENKATYSNFLPMLHLRYRLTPRTNLRAAFTAGIARPDYETLVPFRIILREDEEMVLGNPDLVPTTAMNFDLLGEHYFQGIGILSGGVFYKRLDNIIYPSLYDMSGGPYDGYLVEQAVQGEEATLFGFELNWQQQLTFLPGFLKGFGIYANYTYTTSNATVNERKDVPLPGQAGNVANFALSYEKGGFSGRVSLNYHGSYLDFLGEDDESDIYYDNHLQWDFSASQNILGGLQVYLQAINLNNEPLRYYIGRTSRPTQREFYSWWMHGGLRYSF
jgi:TonB-dependent receptor